MQTAMFFFGWKSINDLRVVGWWGFHQKREKSIYDASLTSCWWRLTVWFVIHKICGKWVKSFWWVHPNGTVSTIAGKKRSFPCERNLKAWPLKWSSFKNFSTRKLHFFGRWLFIGLVCIKSIIHLEFWTGSSKKSETDINIIKYESLEKGRGGRGGRRVGKEGGVM